MSEFHNSFVSRSFLRSVWGAEYEAFKGSQEEEQLRETLRLWSERKDLKETSAEAAFLQTFFVELWGYTQAGQQEKKLGFTLHPKYAVKGAGERGGTGEADLAIGWFDNPNLPGVPQVLCEFKDIRSALDAPQKRKGNTREPYKQCLDYLSASRRTFFGNEAILPTWGVVTDMNEFRLYWYDRAPQQYLSFVIQPQELFQGAGLLAKTEEARFDQFVFLKLFHRDTLLTTGGKPLLVRLIGQQWVQQRELENEFYGEYRRFRERLYRSLVECNPNFPHTKGRLVRLAQKILDRCLFIFYCEDMGRALGFGTDEFEESLALIGKHLGFKTQRPEKESKAKLDVLWAIGAQQYILFPCKSGAVAMTISKQYADQVSGNVNWFTQTYGPGCIATPIIIHPSVTLDKDAYAPETLRVMDKAMLSKFREAVTAFASGIKNGLDSPAQIKAHLNANKLLAEQFIDAFSCPAKQS